MAAIVEVAQGNRPKSYWIRMRRIWHHTDVTFLLIVFVHGSLSGVVEGRKGRFVEMDLTEQTHYLASTGIAGTNEHKDSLVSMDAYAVDGISEDKITYLKGSTHLNPTHEYGVTFERGTCITYGDRKHIFISGTASIDNKGRILHEGDVKSQAVRMMENISALLREADSGIDEIRSAILYLRDASDYAAVSKLFKERWPMLDPVYVKAPVCRPGWLIEMECVANQFKSNTQFANL